MKSPPIYMIYLFKINPKINESKEHEELRGRTLCFFYNIEDAINLIKDEGADIFEWGYFDHAFIEEAYEYSIHPNIVKCFRAECLITKDYSSEDKRYNVVECENPLLKGIVGYSMG